MPPRPFFFFFWFGEEGSWSGFQNVELTTFHGTRLIHGDNCHEMGECIHTQ